MGDFQKKKTTYGGKNLERQTVGRFENERGYMRKFLLKEPDIGAAHLLIK